MSRFHWTAVATSLLFAGIALAHDQESDRRMAGTVVDAGGGKTITIMYMPRHYSEKAFSSPGQFKNFLPRLATLKTQVDLKIGDKTVPAGDYAAAGFVVSDTGEWSWVVKNGETELARLPLPVKDSGDKATHLTLTLQPGDAADTFNLTYHYGPKVATVSFTAASGAKAPDKQ